MALEYNWYAIYVRSRREKVTAKLLEEKGIEIYLPLQRKLRQWSDRKKWVEVPYINSYVFVKTSEKEYFEILNTQGVVRYVSFEGKAAVIPPWQIEAMRKIISSDIPISFSTQWFKKGDQIVIESGVLMGYKGEVIKDTDGKKRMLIRIGKMGISMLAQIDLNTVKKISVQNNKKT